MIPATFRSLYAIGAIKFGRPSKGRGCPISYLTNNQLRQIKDGTIRITGHDANGSLEVAYAEDSKTTAPKTQWNLTSHEAGAYGTNVIGTIIPGRRFAFPKSLYAVADALRFFVKEKPEALIIDFFAGSGTTLHAVNLLNAEDSGHRRCIMVTNNEISEPEKKNFEAHGIKPGDPEWESRGIARYVTWPRTVCSIEGHDVNGNPLKGNYIGSDAPMADGFKANAAFFKLGFLDKASVRVGRQFREMLPTLWMKAGCYGPCPSITGDIVPDFLILPENGMAILTDNTVYAAFREQVEKDGRIDTVYLVTDSEADYRNMARGLSASHKYQLYRDYLDNFRINSRG